LIEIFPVAILFKKGVAMFDKLKKVADFIKEKAGIIDIVIVGGTGVELSLEAEEVAKINYADIPFLPTPTVKSHKGFLQIFKKGNKTVCVANGRFHYYEGYSMDEVVFLVRALKLDGADLFFLTNAAGGLNPLFKKGDLMVVVDHINFMGINPLRGKNLEELGERFPDMSEPYSKEHIEIIKKCALKNKIELKEGVYVAVSGPSMETPSETRMLRMIGADAVGMSTVPEVIALNHAGCNVVAVSIITNENRPDCMEKAPLDEVIKAASSASLRLSRLINCFVEAI